MKSFAFCCLIASQFDSAISSGSDWDYHHMDHWVDSYPMCGSNDQSPIDIQTANAVNDDEICDKYFEWDLNYNHSTFLIMNNGHSVVLKAVEVSDGIYDEEVSEGIYDEEDNEYMTLGLNENTIATFPNYFLPMQFNDLGYPISASEHDTFCLDSFHFHWGNDSHGSEHMVDHEQPPLEVHFVHYSCEHASLGTTLSGLGDEDAVETARANEEDVHQLAVVGIFFDVTNETNPAFETIFEDHLDNIQYPDKRGYSEIVHGLDLRELIPEYIESAGYYAYEGSLTTPPCTNIVRWHVMNARGYIGEDQVEQFRKLFADDFGSQISPNYREVQDNVHTVYACMEGESDPDVDTEDTDTMFFVVCGYAVVVVMMQCTFGAICCWRQKRRDNRVRKPLVMAVNVVNTAGASTSTASELGHH